MNVAFFMKSRIKFIRQFYERGSAPFIEVKRKIEAEEEPFVTQLYGVEDEPPYLTEFMEAEDSLLVLGYSCLSMLSTSLNLYFKAWEHESRNVVDKNDKELKKAFKKGLFHGYKTHFLRCLGIDFDAGPIDLVLIEEVVLARNHIQHPHSLCVLFTQYDESSLENIGTPRFINDFDKYFLESLGSRSLFAKPSIQVTSDNLLLAIDEVERFSKWFEDEINRLHPEYSHYYGCSN